MRKREARRLAYAAVLRTIQPLFHPDTKVNVQIAWIKTKLVKLSKSKVSDDDPNQRKLFNS